MSNQEDAERPTGSVVVKVISVPDAAGALLAVVVSENVADIDRAVRLRGTARRLVEAVGIPATEDVIARWLRDDAGASPAQADHDARHFVLALAKHGFQGLAGGREAPRAVGSDREPSAPNPTTDVDAVGRGWSALARALVAEGCRFRFRAAGRSMRPAIPHGARIEIAPRPFAHVRRGDVVLYERRRGRLVAHRVLGTRAGALLVGGDSSLRIDVVRPQAFHGVVIARERRGRWRCLSTVRARCTGLAGAVGYRAVVTLGRAIVIRPLRATYARHAWVRALPRAILGLAAAGLRRLERLAVRACRPLDVLRAALMSSSEKDAARRALYARRAIQGFTALDENIDAALTLLEEVLLARHPLPAGKALVLGCGPGRECLALARRGFTVTGLDRDPGMLDRARNLSVVSGVAVRYVAAEATDFDVDGGPFDVAVIFSGLYNMVQPSARRIAMLAACARHLRSDGRVMLTFLSAYVAPGAPPPRGKRFLEAINPDHQHGDIYLVNEAVHIFPRAEDIADEARAAGLETLDVFRDQRAYDRASGQVRGYAVLRRPPPRP